MPLGQNDSRSSVALIAQLGMSRELFCRRILTGIGLCKAMLFTTVGEQKPFRLEAVFLTTQPECAFSTFHDALDGLARVGNVDRTLANYRAARFIPCCAISKPCYKLGVAIDD